FSLCPDSLASAATSVGRNLITLFSAVNTRCCEFFASRARASTTRLQTNSHAWLAKSGDARADDMRLQDESAQNKRVLNYRAGPPRATAVIGACASHRF